MFTANTVRLSAVISAATFARNNVRARTGKGASTRTSRWSGNVESQHRTVNNPTTTHRVGNQKVQVRPRTQQDHTGRHVTICVAQTSERRKQAQRRQQRSELSEQLTDVAASGQELQIHH